MTKVSTDSGKNRWSGFGISHQEPWVDLNDLSASDRIEPKVASGFHIHSRQADAPEPSEEAQGGAVLQEDEEQGCDSRKESFRSSCDVHPQMSEVRRFREQDPPDREDQGHQRCLQVVRIRMPEGHRQALDSTHFVIGP